MKTFLVKPARLLLSGICFLFVNLFVLSPVRAQISDQVFKSDHHIDPEKKGQLFVELDNISFFKDNEIIYIEVNLHSLIYHTRSGIYEAYGSLKDLELILDESKFSRCNSCYLVNLDFVQKIDGDECVLPTEKLPISRSKKKKFIEKFLSNI